MMIIRKEGKRHQFIVIDKMAIEDNLSLEAKGLYVYLMAKPDNWTISVKQIQSKHNIGRDKLRRIFSELEKSGYAKLVGKRQQSGKVLGREWIIYETPSLSNRSPEKAAFGPPKDLKTERLKNRTPEKPTVGKPVHILSNKKRLNNKREELKNKEERDSFFSFFLKTWNLTKSYEKIDLAAADLIPQDLKKIRSHLPVFLAETKRPFQGNAHTYLEQRKWEAIPMDKKQNTTGRPNPPAQRKWQ